jgi:hypothetical protein
MVHLFCWNFALPLGLRTLKNRLITEVRIARQYWAPRAELETETLVRWLYDGLTDAQRDEICLEWDVQDETRGLVRRFIANHWQVTRPCILSRFFTPAQQALIHDIFDSLVDPAWRINFMRQLADDTKQHRWGQDQSIAILGNPHTGPYQFLFTGRHLTLRAGSVTLPDTAFSGPIVYGHAAGGFWEKPQHPRNIFWPQALAAAQVYESLNNAQRALAVVPQLPAEHQVNFGGTPQGIAVAMFTPAQQAGFNALLQTLLSPFRAADRARVMRCLKRQGGMDALHLAYAEANRMSAPHWDVWRIEGPAFVWHFQGWPHVHAWVHVAEQPGLPVNARHGAFLFPEHDPLL